VLLGVLCTLVACTGKSEEERAREAEEEIDKSMPEVEATALAQTVGEDVVKEVQRNLTKIHEYQGEINGVLDSVTLNALEAFQRSLGEPDNGIIDDKVRRKLEEAAQQGG
jgi:peptidoglycan hydrolase-like protein with peptidoglycan-binding domain